MNSLVHASGLTLAQRLETVSLSFDGGQCVGLVGPNGSGKTSLLHALAGIPPATGTVTISGADPRGLHPFQRQRLLSFLPATRETVWPLPVRELIQLGLPPQSDWWDVAAQLELVPLLDRRMDQISTGERSRVMIARALAPDAKLLLLDEPVANLDPYWQLLVLELLRERAEASGAVVLVAIHDLAAATDWSNRLLVMNQCVLIADGTPSEVLASGVINTVFRVEICSGAPRLTARADPQSSQ